MSPLTTVVRCERSGERVQLRQIIGLHGDDLVLEAVIAPSGLHPLE